MTVRKFIYGLVILGIALGIFFVGKYYGEKSCPPAATPAKTSAPAVTQPPPVVTPKLPSIEERLALATGGNGEGVVHPFTRQLMADPTLIIKPKEQYKGDRADTKALKRWAGREAYLIAIEFGYADWKFGAEIRIRRPGETAFLLSKDAGGQLHATEYVTATPGKGFGVSPKPAQDRLLASSVSESQFLGMPDNQKNIPVYEYLYAGQG